MDLPRVDGFDDTIWEREAQMAAVLEEKEGQGLPRAKDFVCVDGSEGADRAVRWALNNIPKDHRLVMVHGLYAPLVGWHGEELKLEHELVRSRYEPMCKAAGRECSYFTFPYLTTGDFGAVVCNFARYNGVRSVVTGRRSQLSGLRRQFLGSASQSIVNQCAEVPVTAVADIPLGNRSSSTRQEER